MKILFWTDSGSLIGILPPWHANGDGKLRLITFPTTDYPNDWGQEAQIEDGKWYHLRVDFSPGIGSTAVSIFLDENSLGSGVLPFEVLGSDSDPQIGVYSFDYGHHDWPTEGVKLWLNDPCLGAPSGTCPSGGAASVVIADKSAVAPVATPQHLASCCAAISEQCGGEGFQGPPCCQAGSTCIVKTPQLFRCMPDSEVTSLMERAPRSPAAYASLLSGCAEVHWHGSGGEGRGERLAPAAPLHELPKPLRRHAFLSPAHALVQLNKLVAKHGGDTAAYAEEELEGEENRATQSLNEVERNEL